MECQFLSVSYLICLLPEDNILNGFLDQEGGTRACSVYTAYQPATAGPPRVVQKKNLSGLKQQRFISHSCKVLWRSGLLSRAASPVQWLTFSPPYGHMAPSILAKDKNVENYTPALEGFQISGSIKIFLNAPMPIHFSILYSCFSVTEELNGCMACKA